jgi:hypothetical protein
VVLIGKVSCLNLVLERVELRLPLIGHLLISLAILLLTKVVVVEGLVELIWLLIESPSELLLVMLELRLLLLIEGLVVGQIS